MLIDIEKYRRHLASYNMSKEREEETIKSLCAFMDEFVLIAQNKHPVQQAIREKNRKTLQSHDGVIDSKDRSLKSPYRNAASKRSG
jgi:hypothetical protein